MAESGGTCVVACVWAISHASGFADSGTGLIGPISVQAILGDRAFELIGPNPRVRLHDNGFPV